MIRNQLFVEEDNEFLESEDTGSDFGRGFLYCIFLFAEHIGKVGGYRDAGGNFIEVYISTWLARSSDHFYELVIPERLQDTELGNRIASLQSYCLHNRFSCALEVIQYIKCELHDIMIQLDYDIFNVSCTEATWK